MEITLAIAILGCVLSVSSFVLGRKDKAVKDTKEEESDKKLINYRLDELSRKIDRILDKLDTYDTEIDTKIDKAFKHHLREYHKENK